MIKVTVWNEYLHEDPEHPKSNERSIQCHPNGLHETIAEIVRELGADKVEVRTAVLKQPEHGLTQEVLDDTDVLLWWGHMGHHLVEDEIVNRVYKRVLEGMGLVVLHSGHHSKIFKKLNGTTCNLKWMDGAYERLFTIDPAHPIAQGIPPEFELGIEECYGEFFDIAKPDSVIFQGWFDCGEVFRSGCTFTRGYGRIFYLQPGHETNTAYQNPYIRRIIQNAVEWCYSEIKRPYIDAPMIKNSLESIRKGEADGEYLKHFGDSI